MKHNLFEPWRCTFRSTYCESAPKRIYIQIYRKQGCFTTIYEYQENELWILSSGFFSLEPYFRFRFNKNPFQIFIVNSFTSLELGENRGPIREGDCSWERRNGEQVHHISAKRFFLKARGFCFSNSEPANKGGSRWFPLERGADMSPTSSPIRCPLGGRYIIAVSDPFIYIPFLGPSSARIPFFLFLVFTCIWRIPEPFRAVAFTHIWMFNLLRFVG